MREPIVKDWRPIVVIGAIFLFFSAVEVYDRFMRDGFGCMRPVIDYRDLP